MLEKEGENEFSFCLNKFSSDVSFAFAVAALLANRSWHDNDFVCNTDVVPKLQMMTKLVQRNDDGLLGDITYEEFVAFLDSAYHNKELNFFKEMNSSQVSKDADDFIKTINTYFYDIDHPIIYENDNIGEETFIEQISNENESYEEEITYIMDVMNQMKIDYDKNVREYEKEKKFYAENNAKLYEIANSNKVQLETQYKSDMIIQLRLFEKNLEEFEKLAEDKQNELDVLKQSNNVETDYMKNEILRKEMSLKVAITRYSNRMFSTFRKKQNLQQTNESMKNSVEILEEKISSLRIYHKELEDDEIMYLKQDFDNRIHAIRKKIALRAISKFLIPYITMKFKSKRLKKKKKADKTNI